MIGEDSSEGLEQAIALKRFGSYLGWASGDKDQAIALYSLNTRISESLYTPLQMLEVVLRNRIHFVMSAQFHEGWFHDGGALLGVRQPEQLAKAIEDIRGEHKEPTSGRIVAALTFSFWTSMLGSSYENLWQTTLHRIGSRADRRGLRRKDFSGPLSPIRTLRNRVAHHEPIIMWDLRKHHLNMLELTSWLSPAAATWCRENDRFDQIYPTERIFC